MSDAFDDLLEANRAYASKFGLAGAEGRARAGVALVTCMDSRIDALGMLGLSPGDAKVIRNPGGRVTEHVLEALVLCVHLLQVDRILVVPHTRCTMASYTLQDIRQRISEATGEDVSWQTFGVVADQEAALHDDVRKVSSHPLIPRSVAIGGFIYDVDTSLLNRVI